MDTKLTLKLDKDIIEKAKAYASQHKKSLSSIIESYLQSLTFSGNSSNTKEIEISSFVKSISLKNTLPADFNYKEELSRHYLEKYK